MKSETKFRTVCSSKGNQLVESKNAKNHAVSKGFVDVPNLKAGNVYEFKLVWYVVLVFECSVREF